MKSYRDFLKENTKEHRQQLQYVPVGGFYPDKRLTELLSQFNEAGGGSDNEAVRRLPSPILYDRFDIAFLYQFPPAFHSQALAWRYDQMLFETKKMQMEGKEIPEQMNVTLRGGKAGPITFKVYPNAERLLRKLETPFSADDIMGSGETLQDKKGFAKKIYGSDDDWKYNSSLDGEDQDHWWFDPAFAAHGYDLTPSGEYEIENPGKRDKSQRFGKNFIGLSKDLATEHLNRWRTGAVTGWNVGNPLRNEAIYGDQSNYAIQPVSYSGGKSKAIVDRDGQVHLSSGGGNNGIQMPVFTDGGMHFALELMAAHGVQGIDMKSGNIDQSLFPFTMRGDGSVRWNAYGPNGDPIKDLKVLGGTIPILTEGELIDARDWGAAFGKFRPGPDDPKPMMDQIAEMAKGKDPRLDDTIQEFMQLRDSAGRFDWHDHALYFSNIAKAYPEDEPDEDGNMQKQKWNMPFSITGKRIKDPDYNIVGGGNMFKGEKWCWPPEDKGTFEAIRDLTHGDMKQSEEILAQATDNKSKIAGAAAVGVRKQLEAIGNTPEARAMKACEDKIVDMVADRLTFCISGHPLIVTYVRIKNGTWTFEDAPWQSEQWRRMGISIVRPGNEHDPDAMLKDLENQVYKFFRDKAQSFTDTVSQLDWGRGARRMRGKERGEQKSLDELQGTVSNAAKIVGLDDEDIATMGGRKAGDRTNLRQSVPRMVRFAHSLSEIMQQIKTLQGEAGQYMATSEKQKQQMEMEEAGGSLMDAVDVAAEMYDKYYLAYLVQQILAGNTDVSSQHAEVYAVEQTARAMGQDYDPKDSNLGERASAEKLKAVTDQAAGDLSGLPENMRAGVQELMQRAINGDLDEEALENVFDNIRRTLSPEEAAELDKVKAMLLGPSNDPNADVAAAAKQGVAGPAGMDINRLMQSFSANPAQFAQAAAAQMKQSPQVAVELVKSAAAAKSQAGEQWKASLQKALQLAPQAFAQAQQMAKGDQAFAAGLAALQQVNPKESVGAGTGAIFDGSKSRDWNWSGSPGSTGTTPKEDPIKSWLKKKRNKK